MKLHFSQHVNGKATNFVEKIWSGLIRTDPKLFEDFLYPDNFPNKMPWPPTKYRNYTPKIHTIRRDLKNRWKPKALIHFIINFRGNEVFQFAPVLKVISTQKILIKHEKVRTGVWFLDSTIWIDGKKIDHLYTVYSTLANNSGFETIDEFFDYFSEDYIGKIIHWTPLKY